MKKNIYGIIDRRSSNFGDICLLDRDEEFRDGCLKLFSNPDIPEYVIMDLVAVRYGSFSFDSNTAYPKFDILDLPEIICYGADALCLRKDDVSHETVTENS